MKATFHAPRLKYSLFDVYMMLLIFMTMTSLMAKKLDGINKILFLVIFFFQVIILFGRLTKKYLCLFVISVFSYIVALMNTENLTFGNGQNAGEHVENGGLAAAGGSKQSNKFTAFKGGGQIVNSGGVAESLSNVL